jgi:hypothetical protein
MLTSLADLPSIHARARRILTAAAALSAAVMSPVACELLLGNLVSAALFAWHGT